MLDRLSERIGPVFRGDPALPKANPEDRMDQADRLPQGLADSVVPSDLKAAQDHLRTMAVEREVLSYAIRRLYEVEAEGSIDKLERDQIARRYKTRMMQVKDSIDRNQSMLTLCNLECAQADLMALFNKHFDDLNQKVSELRSRLDLKPVSPPPRKTKETKRQKKQKKKKRSSATGKNDIAERIEKIRGDVDQALGRLDRIETQT
jgi:hypothetical protein